MASVPSRLSSSTINSSSSRPARSRRRATRSISDGSDSASRYVGTTMEMLGVWDKALSTWLSRRPRVVKGDSPSQGVESLPKRGHHADVAAGRVRRHRKAYIHAEDVAVQLGQQEAQAEPHTVEQVQISDAVERVAHVVEE